ncbi:hypothetical protein Tco_1042207 [Tanacetum coccineum]|uniref:Uncharacterized protein n=1 Tax=Tanacetum coccineum TaxID=301880 RepID=A0ABQ5GID5_9ASTR
MASLSPRRLEPAVIFITLSDPLQARLVVEHPKSAKEAWDLISDIVRDNKRSRINALKAELRSIKLGDLSMESYFCKIESIVTILTSLTLASMMKMLSTMLLKAFPLRMIKSLSLPVDFIISYSDGAHGRFSINGSRWMRKFIDGLGNVVPSNKRPMEMLCDNDPGIAIVNDPEILKGSRHFQRKYHYIREVIQEREIVLKKVYTNDYVDDPFTKPMPFNKHYEHAMSIGIVPTSSLM